MATKKKMVGENAPTNNSYITETINVIEKLKKEAPSATTSLKIKALQIFLSVCKHEKKKQIADDKLKELINNK